MMAWSLREVPVLAQNILRDVLHHYRSVTWRALNWHQRYVHGLFVVVIAISC